jgi:4-hydroxy-2-oxoheptanedioate aldolase
MSMNVDLKARLSAPGVVVGTFLQDVRDPFVVQLVAAAGLDFVIIDTEHGAFNRETVADLIKLARALDVIPIVRVIAPTYEYLCPPLDAGATALLLPRIDGPEVLRSAVRMTRYPPQGVRGLVMVKGQTDYVLPDLAEYAAAANKTNVLIPQIELRQALEKLDDILSVDGVAVALVGPCDLSVALGRPGQFDHPEQVRSIEQVIEACRRHDVVPGIAVGSVAAARTWMAKGMRFVCCGADVSILRAGLAEIAQLKPRR